MPVLHVNSALQLKATFTVRTIRTDPTTVILEVEDPDGVKSTYNYAEGEVVREKIGVYSKVIEFDKDGWWSYEWHATGAVVVVDGKRLQIERQFI